MPSETSIDTPAYQVLLYYRYVAIEQPETYMEEHRQLCQDLNLEGRIIVGIEGINGTVSGTYEETQAYIEALHADPRSADMPFKVDPADGHAFPKLSIKVRDEIVTLGLDAADDIDPNSLTGVHLSPQEFYDKMQEDNVVIIDGRNAYEADLGHFKNAICPPIDNFRDFPAWLEENRNDFEGKEILTYCTGGIRCEKLSGYIKKEGFDDLYQLDGGIVTYGKDPAVQGRDFDGLCYVFDERIGVEVNHTETHQIISKCRYCDSPEQEYSNCQLVSCNARIFICSSCREQHGTYCDSSCRTKAESTLADSPSE